MRRDDRLRIRRQHGADVQVGDTVVIVGVGGIGAAAIQGARVAGAQQIVAIDPVPWKLDQAKIFGATHTASSMADALPLLAEITRGVMADSAILTVGVAHGDMVGPLMSLVRKGGNAVVTAVAPFAEAQANLSLFELTIWQKQLRGSLYGAYAPAVAVPRLLNLYRRGLLQLDEMVTRPLLARRTAAGLRRHARRAQHPRAGRLRLLTPPARLPPRAHVVTSLTGARTRRPGRGQARPNVARP